MEGAVGSTELWQVWKHNFSTIKLDPIFRNRTHGLRVDANRLKVVFFGPNCALSIIGKPLLVCNLRNRLFGDDRVSIMPRSKQK